MRQRENPRADLLALLPMFDGCSRKQLNVLARGVEDVRVPSGEDVVTEGSAGHHVFILAEGLAHATVRGRRVGTIRPGSVFGEIAVLDHEPRSATVTTALPSRLLVLDARRFRALLDTAPSVARRILRTLAGRVRENDELLAAGA